MTERDLENLKSLPVPQARSDAKRAALVAAMAAFENEHASSSLPAGAPLGVSEATTEETSSKGNIIPLRQTETSTLKRSFRMNFSSRSTQAIAASVAALVVAAPFAFQHLATLREAPTLTVAQTELKTAAGSSSAPASAPVARKDDGLLRKSDGPTDELVARQQGGEKKKAEAVAAKPVTVAESEPALAAPLAPPSAADARQESAVAAAAPETTLSGNIKFHDLGKTAQGGAISVGQHSQKSDNSAVLVSGAGSPLPLSLQSTDTLHALKKLKTADPTTVARINDELGRRMESPKAIAPADPSKPNPYAWMGRADEQRAIVQEENRDKFDAREINAIKQAAVEPVSTFSIDVDTASYAFARRALNAGRLPPRDSVRVEEMINYFPYAYPAPETADVPFKPTVTVMPSPWNANNKLVHVAIKGYDLKSAERPRANLVFLMDVSGSMAPADRLPLVKNAFRMLVEQLKPDDTVAIVTYASGSGIALEPTKISDKGKILSAIDRLGAGGSTAGAAGISDAYRLAEAGFDKSAVNRVILATDGDFNVGITDKSELQSFIERKRQSGIFLSILGVGQGNHNDALMQTLAQNGNGTAAYADTLSEARKVLVDEASSTLFTIAKDVKAQIEWNPARVAEYRLIGYETRALKREDFNNDKVDAGDIGSGHTVTAIYEITPVGAQLMSDALRYGQKTAVAPVASEPTDLKAVTASNELGFLKLRYKRPNEDTSQLITLPLTDALAKSNMTEVPVEQRFSIAVAAFAQMLKGESYIQNFTADDVLALAQSARGDDPFGYRAEFLNLVRLAKSAQP